VNVARLRACDKAVPARIRFAAIADAGGGGPKGHTAPSLEFDARVGELSDRNAAAGRRALVSDGGLPRDPGGPFMRSGTRLCRPRVRANEERPPQAAARAPDGAVVVVVFVRKVRCRSGNGRSNACWPSAGPVL
jgi:hypothetical protein